VPGRTGRPFLVGDRLEVRRRAGRAKPRLDGGRGEVPGSSGRTTEVGPGRAVPGEGQSAWPPWLSSVAGDAILGWVPRRADSFEKLDKIGQGTYSNVYKARDLEDGSIVALKKVRFDNLEAESVRFMAREIEVLRRLDHPNIVKLKGLVTSRVSCSLYLVFEYMEHDLAGLAACPGVTFTDAQIKCYMLQLLRGLEHCHSRGVLHRDIKGSNLLLDNNGILKIADFGLATFYRPDAAVPLTSRVVTLWYRPPELLLGATAYGAAVDLWSTGCILAELLAGKPIMPGRTEVEQLHKIFKLCGSPSDDYWRRSRLPHATIFKPQQPYKRCLRDTYAAFPPAALALLDVLLAIEPGQRGTATQALKHEYFHTEPYPCDPSSLPEYPPSKEYDAKLRDEEARRMRAGAGRNRNAHEPSQRRRESRHAAGRPNSDLDPSGQLKPAPRIGLVPSTKAKSDNKLSISGADSSGATTAAGPSDARDSTPPGTTSRAPPSRHVSKSGPLGPVDLRLRTSSGPIWEPRNAIREEDGPAARMGPLNPEPRAPDRRQPVGHSGPMGIPHGPMWDTVANAYYAQHYRDSLRAPERDALKAAERLKGADHDRAGPLPGRPRPIKSVPDLHQRGFPVEATQVLNPNPVRDDRFANDHSFTERPHRRAPREEGGGGYSSGGRSRVHHRPQSGELRKEEIQQTMLAAHAGQQPPPPLQPPSQAGSQALPPVPWRSGQLTRKVSGTFADKRLFEHKGWMLSVSTGRNGVAEHQLVPGGAESLQGGGGGRGGQWGDAGAEAKMDAAVFGWVRAGERGGTGSRR
ncbi:Cdc2-related protein kinase, partial [Klebsormidium nitens]